MHTSGPRPGRGVGVYFNLARAIQTSHDCATIDTSCSAPISTNGLIDVRIEESGIRFVDASPLGLYSRNSVSTVGTG